jgi:glycosyltransferase involved in cell wall biosynthesis
MKNDSQPLVTIAIPTYNRAGEFLRTALESALDQTYETIDVVVVDNCSTDHTPDLVRSYQADHPNLRYVRNSRNVGPFRNFQRCLDTARGSYFLMLHDDDSIDVDMISTCLEAANYDTDLSYIRTGTRIIDVQGRTTCEHPNRAVGLKREAYLYAWLNTRVYWYFSSSLLNTQMVRAVGGFPIDELLVDVSTFARMVFQGDGLDLRPVKASCRQHNMRITTRTDLQEWIDDYCRHRDLLVTLSSEGWRTAIRKRANAFFSLICCLQADELPNSYRRFRAYVEIARAFGVRHIPHPVSKAVGVVLPSRIERGARKYIRGFRGRIEESRTRP